MASGTQPSTDRDITFVVEHLDPELGPWSELEYKAIAQESRRAGCHFVLSSVPEPLLSSEALCDLEGASVRTQSVDALFEDQKQRVCLLDPAAQQDLSPSDINIFNVFLFGGILGRTVLAHKGEGISRKTDIYVGDDPPRGHGIPTPRTGVAPELTRIRSHVRIEAKGVPRATIGSETDDYRHSGTSSRREHGVTEDCLRSPCRDTVCRLSRAAACPTREHGDAIQIRQRK